MVVRRKITLEQKTRKRTFACAAAILVVVTALTLFSGCVDEDTLDDLGEPMKKVNHYVGKEGFNVDVDEKIFGKESIYYLAEKETGAKSPIMEFKPCAKVVEETYLGEDGAKVIKYKIGKKRYDKQQIKKSGIKNIEDSYLPEDKILLMIKKLPDGTYDLSDLTESTEALGWEHITKTGYFPGSDKNPKATDNIMGNNRGKPELRMEIAPGTDGERLSQIVIFNKAYVNQYKKIGGRTVGPGGEIPDKSKFKWANEAKLTPQDKLIPQVYKELFDGELYCMIGSVHPGCSDARIGGTPDCEYGIIIQKNSITSLTGQLSRSATCPWPLSLQAAMPPQLIQQWLSRSTQLLPRVPRVTQVSRQQLQE